MPGARLLLKPNAVNWETLSVGGPGEEGGRVCRIGGAVSRRKPPGALLPGPVFLPGSLVFEQEFRVSIQEIAVFVLSDGLFVLEISGFLLERRVREQEIPAFRFAGGDFRKSS